MVTAEETPMTEERQTAEGTPLTEEERRRERENLERIASFTLMDDEFMTKCFDGAPEAMELVLRILLDMPELKVTEVRTQVFVENLLHRSLRLDVKAVDSLGRRINVEIQRRDQGADRKRARYHSSMMDTGLLEKGDGFGDLPEVWVIFITEHDILGRGEPLYRIERHIEQTGERFGDGSHILYVNGENRSDTPLGRLMRDFSCADPSQMYYKPLADRTRFYKESKEGVGTMSKVIEEYALRRAEEERRKIAIRLLQEGNISLEVIARASDLTLDEVRRLQLELTATA